jgi:hypothetical protein
LFYTGKNFKGRYASSTGSCSVSPIVRYYPQTQLADFNAAILAELGLQPGTPMGYAFARYTVVEGGWQQDQTGDGQSQRWKPKKRKGGQRQVPSAAIQRINGLRRRLLRTGDLEGAEECRLAIEELRRWAD